MATPDADALVESHLWLAREIARESPGRGPGDSLRSAYYGLFRAALAFRGDPADFRPYARTAIRRTIVDDAMLDRLAVLPTSYGRRRGRVIEPGRLAGEPAAEATRPGADDRDECEAILSDLPPELRAALSLRFGLDGGRERSGAEIAREMGVSKATANRWCGAAERSSREAGARRGGDLGKRPEESP